MSNEEMPTNTNFQEGLPELSQFDKFVKSVQRAIFSGKDWKSRLDNIFTWWKEGGNIGKGEEQRLSVACAAANIPELERGDGRNLLTSMSEDITNLIQHVRSLASEEQPRWKEVREISDEINVLKSKDGDVSQASALLEVLQEETFGGLKPEDMRRKVAQHAWSELWNTGNYRILHYSAADVGEDVWDLTTQDQKDVEKDELRAALRVPFWDEKKIKHERKTYRGWLKAIRDDEVSDDWSIDPSVGEDIKLLWDAVRGENTHRVSAVQVLRATQRAYKALERVEAFDIDLQDVGDEE